MLKLKKIKSSELIGERSGFEKSRWTVAVTKMLQSASLRMWIAHDNHTGLVRLRKSLVAVLTKN